MNKKSSFRKRMLSMLLAVLMAFTAVMPATAAFAGDGVEGYHEIELFYKQSDTIIPTYIDDTLPEDERQTYVEYMIEGQELELTYKLIDTVMPDNGYVKWYSETPSLVDVTQEGVVKAFDSSKGAVVQAWIDNEVKTIPLLGGAFAKVIEKALFNEYVDVDTMDTDAIVAVVEGLFQAESANPALEGYKDQLLTSLRYYLDNINSNIHVQLFDADGTLLDDDYVQICVQKCEEWYANFLPNGTHITNKSQVPTTVAVGSTVQLYAITTPLRLHYKTIYSVKSSSIFDQGKVVATVNDGGLVTFKNKGTVTIMASPDTEEIIQKILEMVNYFYTLENTGTINTDQIAKILIEYVGLDINRNVLAAMLDVCFAVKDIVGDTADPVQLTATAVEIISNLVLQFVYNDSITFTVVDAQPLEDFNIDGPTSVKEGSQIQLSLKDIVPSTGDTTDVTWRSSDPNVAYVDPQTGIVTGRDAGGSLGNLSANQCTIYAVSAANGVERPFTITVTGKTGKYLSDVEITGKSYLEMGEETDYLYCVFPQRIAESENLYISWGIKTGVDEEENPVYMWATPDEPATDGLGIITSNGHYTCVNGGVTTIAVKAQTGYYLSNGNFYEISSFIREFDVTNGIPVSSITITALDGTSNGDLNRVNTVTINGRDYTYVTIYKGVMEGYAGNGAIISATVEPANASNKNLTWVVDNSYYSQEISEDTHTATIKQKAGHEVADTFNVYAVSADGHIASNVITVCVTRNYVTENSIDQSNIELIRGKSTDVTHTISFDGSWTGNAYACYKCNWYSGDESIFTVETKTNDNRDAVITAHDVGTATLYCVSADGGIVGTTQVTVFPDKEYLKNIVNLCDNTVVKRTTENRVQYNEYMRKLDLAYYVLYDEPMASQVVCDTTARQLLFAFYKLGGFVSITGVDILGANKTKLDSDHITVEVGSQSYEKYSFSFDYKLMPKNAMYSDVIWTSSNPNISIDKNGNCKPTVNDPCSARITCTVKDYMGNEISDSVYISFAKTVATGVSLNTDSIVGGKIGESQTLEATVYPDKLVGGASCKDVYWSSSDDEIASVDQNGKVFFNRGGDCIIYCTTYDGGFVAQCAVNVVTNYSNLQLLIQQYNDLQLNSVNYYPDTWENFTSTMAEAQAMIEKGGYSQDEVDAMYAKLEKSYNSLEKYNYIQRIELYLDGEPTSEFYQYDLSLLSEGISYKNAVLDLNVRLYPNNGSYASVKWESSTTDISVTSDGKCSPTKNSSCYGMITCTVTDHFGSQFTDSVWVSYSYYPVTSLDLSESSISGPIGTTHQLACTVQPTGTSLIHAGAASIKDYYWESDNESIATVDQTGLVTFVSAGATVVRAVSYDGGVTGECQVSSEGDRSALKAAIEAGSAVDYKDYDATYGNAFKVAYDNAVIAMTDNTLSQEEIDEYAYTLQGAYNSMIMHPYIKVEGVNLSYTTYKRTLTNSSTQVSTGTVGSNDSLSVNLSSGYSNYNDYNDVKITASAYPSNSMYKAISWSVESSNKMKSSVSDSQITLTPNNGHDKGAWAVVKATITDNYDRTTERLISVVMSDKTCTGIDITQESMSLLATAGSTPIEYTLSGNSEFPTVFWTSSNTDVATVDANGNLIPADKGTATITAKTFDGGYTDSFTVNISTDFSTLALKYNEYFNHIESVKDSYTYTQDTVDVLSARLAEAQQMINDGKATQAEVNAMLAQLEEAYGNLKPYIAATGINISYVEDSSVQSVNPGFVRYTGTSINGKSIQLNADILPADAIYTSIEWTSSNENITIDQEGTLINNSALAGVTLVTCTVTNIRNESYSSSIYVSFVRYGATGVGFADEMVFGAPAQTVDLEPVVTNTNNSNLSSAVVKQCLFVTDNPDVATVDDLGTVTFVSQGVATITATTLDGGYTATIQAYTTWDTTALKAAIDEASAIDYKNYAYDYGTAFNEAYLKAVEVYGNVYATQDEIDLACTALTEAMAQLEGHEFVAPVISITYNGEVVESGALIEVNADTSQADLQLALNDGAMVKSSELAASGENGCTAEINGNTATITKTADGKGYINITARVVDDYNRETTKTYTFAIIDVLVNATSIALTADGNSVSGTVVRSCGGSYTKFTGVTFGYVTTPENANAITSVSYESSSKNYIAIDKNGVATLTAAGMLRSSNTTTITCTVTNADGTTATARCTLTITRS